jgi:hypothetical protein
MILQEERPLDLDAMLLLETGSWHVAKYEIVMVALSATLTFKWFSYHSPEPSFSLQLSTALQMYMISVSCRVRLNCGSRHG